MSPILTTLPLTLPIGGEVPHLVAVQGEIDAVVQNATNPPPIHMGGRVNSYLCLIILPPIRPMTRFAPFRNPESAGSKVKIISFQDHDGDVTPMCQ
jgi:hypothetical protein